ncbi:MAG: indolepyruvate oxidoreductase subunit beta [Desulfobacterales bacterium]|nr:indolepyruvate oxidoreductase subunit beta [Desulfobacterales bacterium]
MKQNMDAFNLIITGVGGQGNVLVSQFIGQVFVNKGYFVTIGETYGASQRGGSVMSHIRISGKKQRSPLIPRCKGDIVVAMEPVEALRVLSVYGNPQVKVLVNTRPIYPTGVTTGEETYPKFDHIRKHLDDIATSVYYIDATEKAIKLGSPILGNMVMIGALLALKLLPITFEEFCETLSQNIRGDKLAANMKAIEQGKKAIQ